MELHCCGGAVVVAVLLALILNQREGRGRKVGRRNRNYVATKTPCTLGKIFETLAFVIPVIYEHTESG